MTLTELVQRSHDNAVSKGFWSTGSYPEIGTKIALIHSEVSEVLEELREHGHMGKIRVSRYGKPEGFMIELADTIIRVADLAGWVEKNGAEITLAEAIAKKMAYNATRPQLHGKNF